MKIITELYSVLYERVMYGNERNINQDSDTKS